MHLQQLPDTSAKISFFFVRSCKKIMNDIYTMFGKKHVFEYMENVCLFHKVPSVLNMLQCFVKKFLLCTVKQWNSFVCSCTEIILMILVKSFTVQNY